MNSNTYQDGELLYPSKLTLHQLFKKQVEKHPQKEALIFDSEYLTFQELDEKSNQLAHYLRALGIGPDQLIALCLDRSFEMIIGIFGILKAGGAYLPIDVNYPEERQNFMLKDASASVLLTQNSLLENFKNNQNHVIALDSDWESDIDFYDKKIAPENINKPSDLAYTIYTSGSTGKPKGVMIEHQHIMNQLQGQQEIAPAPIDKMLLTCSISFDVSVLTIFWSLLQGATLVLPRQNEEKDIPRLANIIEENQVSHLLTLPSLHTLILDQADPQKLTSLKLINVSGEVCPTSMTQKHEKLLPNCQLYNLYGPTEAAVNCTFFTIPKGFSDPKVPIGIPIFNYEMFILDDNLEEVGDGEVGEIYIGGSKPVVGRGYWNRPKLSAERFIKNPHEKVRGGKKLYKTGDLGKWMPDGNIEFLGRVDFQVKFRGFRIELGEIEVAIGAHRSVKETVVVLKNQHQVNQQKLVTYITQHFGKKLNISELRDFIGERLPEYMIPTHFVFLDKMPLTTNGKIDRPKLPEPRKERPELAQKFEVPIGKIEEKITTIWEEILEVKPVGRNDKFFELGGNSILAAKFIGQLSREFETSIFITTIFDHPTVASYAKMLETEYGDIPNLKDLEYLDSPIKDIPDFNPDSYREEYLTATDHQNFKTYIPQTLHQKTDQFDTSKPGKNKKSVFILAPPRSGTTLLRVMLAGHPNLFAANELQLLNFENIQDRDIAYSDKFALWKEGLIRAFMELKNCDAKEAKQIIYNYQKHQFSTKEIFSEIQKLINDKILVDKSPSYALDPLALQKAEQDFESPVYIHLVRHPYSSVTSFEKYRMNQVMFLHPNPFSARQIGELVWHESHKTVSEFLTNIPNERHIKVLYEDLVKNPEKTMRQICKTIGIPFDENVLNPYQNLDKKMVNGIYQDSRSMGDTNFDKQKGINAKSADKWKGVLEDNFLSEESWKLALELGYESPTKEQTDIPNLKDLEYLKSSNALDPDFPKSGTSSTASRTDSNTRHPDLGKSGYKKTDIAIIGMSCRVAGANNVFEFWQNLIEEKDASQKLTKEEFEKAGGDPSKWENENYVKSILSLENYDCFDNKFFGYLPKEAAMMDPQHRVFLETAYEAIENAGYIPDEFDGKIGIFGGVAKNTYFQNNILQNPEIQNNSADYQELLSSDKSFSITRVAYKLNLKGPAVNVQTACSTSGVAIHLACQSLENEDSDIVIVGGGRIQPPIAGYQYFEGGPLAPDGKLRAFDANAQGMVQGNGMAMIVLKKLDKAIEDKDHIWAVIKGTSINNDGAEKIGFTAPSIKGQAECIAKAHEKAGISADQISYLEAHGTGTLLGDPIEIQGLTKSFQKTTDKKQFCAIGSVKTNVGHLDAGACVMGIIKTALALHFEKLPPNLHFEKPNPQIDFANSPFFVNAELKDWKRTELPRMAGVSSFGLGGTNAHIILAEAPQLWRGVALCEPQNLDVKKQDSISQSTTPRYDKELFIFSTKGELMLGGNFVLPHNFFEASLLGGNFQLPPNLNGENNQEKEIANKLGGNWKLPPNKGEIAANLAIGKKHFKHRKALFVNDLINIQTAKQIKGDSEKAHHKIAFLFPGGGAQYLKMGKDLYDQNTHFKSLVDDCLEILKTQQNLDLKALLFSENEADKTILEKPSNALPALFAIEYSMAKLWQFWGIQPAEMIGHSMGEYTAACIAEVMTLEEALHLVTIRGRLFETLPAEGGMLSIPLSETAVKNYMDNGLAVAVINKPDACVVSGKLTSIARLENKLRQSGIEAKRIHISVAAHSPQVEPILDKFEKSLQQIDFQEPTIPFISNVTGEWITNQQATDPNYWIQHIRFTVRFSDGLTTLFENPDRVLLEVGPGQTLSTFARQHPDKNAGQLILASLRHPKEIQNDVEFIQKTIAKLWVNGIDLNWKNYYGKYQKLPLPTYPFERKRHWISVSATPPNPLKRKSASAENLSPELQKSDISPLRGSGGESPATNHQSPVTTPTNSPETELNQMLMEIGIQTNGTQKRTDILITEIKDILYNLSGLEPEEMEVDASFLELGFDSLFLSQVVIQVNNKFETKISFRQLFEEASSIEALAEMLDGILPAEKFQPEPVLVENSVENQAVQTISNNGNGVQISQNGNGQDNGNSQNGNYSNGSNGIDKSLLINNLPNGNGNANLQNILNQQLEIMRQQLKLLQGNAMPLAVPNGKGNSNGKSNENGNYSSNGNGNSNMSKEQVTVTLEGNRYSKKGETELKIKRKSKGVTAKLNNYKKISTADDLTEKQRENLLAFIEKYIAKTSTSKEMASRHRQFYADPRSVTGFSKLWKEIVYQIAHKKSKGAKIWDIDGNEYLDFVMSYGVALFGHMPNFVEESVIQGIKDGNSLDVLPPDATEVAQIVAELSGMDRVTLANTGTEAVLGAVRAARTYSGKDKIAVFDTDYHGMVDQFMVRGVHFKDRTKSLPTSPGISAHIAENSLVLDYDDPYNLEKLRKNIKDLAAVVIEPVQAQNPHWQHFELIKEIRKITAEHDVALIFDEIINGFRLHQRGAQAWYDVEADIVAYGKSISGGLPLSAIAGKAKYMECFDGGLWEYGDDSGPEASVTYFASTFIKNPISVSSAVAAMREIKRRGPALQQELNIKAATFAQKIAEIFLRTKAPLFIQCTSSFFMIKPIGGNPLNRMFHYFLRYRGVNMRERPCFISTAHNDDDLNFALQVIEATIGDMFDAGLIHKYEGENLNIIVGMPPHLQPALDKSNLPLTEGQKEIFVSSQFSDDSNCAYNIGTEIVLEGDFNLEKMKSSLQTLINRHESLRINFAKDGSHQKIAETVKIEVPYFDLSNLSEKGQREMLQNLHSEAAKTPFDLSNDLLIRAKIVRLKSRLHKVLITVHHAVVDGWSLGILTRDLGEIYASASALTDFPSAIAPTDFPSDSAPTDFPSVGALNGQSEKKAPTDRKSGGAKFTNYLKQNNQYRQSQAYQKTNQFWLNKFADAVPQNNFPTDNPRPTFQTYSADCQRIELNSEEYQNLKKTAAKAGSTFYFFLFGAFQSFVSRLAQQDDLTIGIVAAGQNLAGNEKLVGHLANLLPIRMKVDGKMPFKAHLKSVRSNLLDAFDNQNFTFGELVRQLNLERNTSQNPLVSIVFNMDSPLENLEFGNLKATTNPIQKQFETFDFFINVKPVKDKLLFEWFYNTDLFEKETIERRLQEFQVFLNGILENPEMEIGKLPLLLSCDFPSLDNFNNQEKEVVGQKRDSVPLESKKLSSDGKSQDNTIQLFENQALKTPNAIALIFKNEEISYESLNKKANKIANHLISKGVKTGDFVGIFLDRSVDLIAGLLGIWKAGAAYLPLDILNPKERLKFILNDVNAKFILSDSKFKKQLPTENGEVIFSDNLEEEIFVFPNGNPSVEISQNSPAYIIYTSGSTGNPKGIVISHETIVTHLLTMQEMLNFTEKEVIFSVISASFDPSVQDFFLPLISGAKLILASQETIKDANLLKEKLNNSDATWMAATPPTWRMLRLVGWNGKSDLNIISTGEALSKDLAAELMNCGKNLWNFYGPTEATIYATAKKVEINDLQKGQISNWVSIGKSLPKTLIYILDSNLQPLPPNTPGELFIGGFRVADGYHQRLELTEKVFLKNPFRKGELFYRTGDLAYINGDGNIMYINRKDNQIKLRGYRVELGEIEAKIREIEDVNEAVVLLREDVPNEKKLVGYVKFNSGNLLSINDLEKEISKSLPNYMIPSDFVLMEEFPLTSSGKINRKRLPVPDSSREKLVENFAEARTETEEKLTKIWSELLNIPKVGIHDNFYELGGHSLLAVGMMAKIETVFGLRLPLVTFIDYSNIEGIAGIIDAKLGKDLPPNPLKGGQAYAENWNTDFQERDSSPLRGLGGENAEKIIPLTEGQTEIWVSHHLNEEAAKNFNLGVEIRLKGDLDVESLELAIQDLVARHEALRTEIIDGEQQRVLPNCNCPIYWTGSDETENLPNKLGGYKEEIDQVFDLTKAPLARFKLIEISNQVTSSTKEKVSSDYGVQTLFEMTPSRSSKMSPQREFVLIFTMHHIILDGWSIGILINDLGKFYQKRARRNIEIKPQKAQLSDFVKHLQNYSQSTDYQESEQFWLKQFEGEIPLLNFPTDRPKLPNTSFAAADASLIFSNEFIDNLRTAAKTQNCSFYSFMFGAFQAFVGRLAQQKEFVLGVAVSGKSIVEFEDLAAHRTNLLPMKIALEETANFKDFLRKANRNLLMAFDHQDYTLGALLKKLKLTRNGTPSHLVNMVFNMETMTREFNFGNLEVETAFLNGSYKTLDLIAQLKPNKAGFEFKWIYKKALFEQETIERRLKEFEVFLKGILENPNQAISQIPMLPDCEISKIIEFGQPLLQENFEVKCLHQLLENQVEKTPENIAIFYNEDFLTYQELNEKANQLARHLIANGLKINEFVGICLNRSIDILVSIYAVLKAGGTYVPIEPMNPQRRIEGVFEDAKCSQVITHQDILEKTKNYNGKRIILEHIEQDLAAQSPANLNLRIPVSNLAYVIYTSGSTGKPKGVGIPHQNVINTLMGINQELNLTESDVFYSVSSMAFDMCIPNYFLSMAIGAQLTLANSTVKKDGFLLKEDLEKHRPTFMQATPTTWKILLLAGWKGLPKLKVLAGGEGFSKELAGDLLSNCHRVWNGYGPTETTIYATFKEVTWENIHETPDNSFIPIGRPNANVETMILDKFKNPVPIGVAGELFIGGKGVANGYLGRPELTGRMFLEMSPPSPEYSGEMSRSKNSEFQFTAEANSPLRGQGGNTLWYKTGDLVKYLPNGDIDFLGRIDKQLKIRGFRIELGEIEEVLKAQKSVTQSVVSVMKDKSGRDLLVGYVKLENSFDLNEKLIKSELRKELPGYMIPSVFVKMEAFKMTNSAKIDRKNLPIPNLDELRKEREFLLPKSATEKQLHKIWTDILGIENLSIDEDFFELGGHSLLAVGLVARIQKTFEQKLSVTVLFQNSTIQQLAKVIDGNDAEKESGNCLIPVKPQGSKPPIYLVHGGGLHVLFYQALAKNLAEDQPVFALQAYGLDGKNEPLDSIEDMAAQYIKEILVQNPDGPFCLAGYSLGGLIAFEMARQLEALGKKVNLLAMFDAVAKYDWEGNDATAKWKKKMKKATFNLNLLMREPTKAAKYKAEVLRMQMLHKTGKIDVAHGETKAHPSMNKGADSGKKVYEKSLAAFQKYELQSMNVQVDLFKAKEQMFFLHDPKFYGWNHFAEKGVAVHELDGNHLNMFDKINGVKLAKRLQRVLDERNG